MANDKDFRIKNGLQLGGSLVEAVGTIHTQKIVHSDLKPANFLFVEGALKLIDFGIAKQVRLCFTKSGGTGRLPIVRP